MADESGAAMIAGRELPLPNAHGDVALASLFTMGVMLFPNDGDLCGGRSLWLQKILWMNFQLVR
jgi:hypothetical protein